MNLENMTKIYARGDSRIQLKVIPGHFVTSQSHITHYLDLTTMKSRTAEAQNIAHELAANYEVSTQIIFNEKVINGKSLNDLRENIEVTAID